MGVASGAGDSARVVSREPTAAYDGVSRSVLVALLALLVVAIAVRLWRLGSFPANLMADEADNLGTIYQILFGDGVGLFALDWKPSPAFSMYVAAPFVALFDHGLFGLRVASVLTSVLALVPLFALYRRYVSPAAALLSLLLLSTSVWYLNFSRSGWENVHVVLLTALAFWLLSLALETGAWRYWAWAGVAASLGLYSYFAGRAILIALAAYAPIALWQRRDQVQRVALGYVLLVVVAVGLFVPQLPAIREDPEHFNIRAERVSVLAAADDGYFGREGVFEVLVYQAARNARFFFDGGVLGGDSYSPPEQGLQDTRPRYSPFGRPLLDLATALLFVAGLVLSLVRGPGRNAMWWVMLAAPWVLTQVLTINTPDAARGIGMLPAIYFFVALALDGLWRLAARPRALRFALVGAIVIVAAGTTLAYFRWAGSPAALNAREPAVPLTEFNEWKRVQIERTRSDLPPLTVTGWKELHPER